MMDSLVGNLAETGVLGWMKIVPFMQRVLGGGV